MNREYIYRGKRKDTGEWVEGDLINLSDGRKYIVNNKFGACFDDKGNFINTEKPFICEVIPETVGQDTGLHDENGKRIFEGDVVKFRGRLFEIVYITEYARFAGREPGTIMSVFDIGNAEVIGNIHDTTEKAGEIVDTAPTISHKTLSISGGWRISSDGWYLYCSKCGVEPKGGMSNFCPNCGADMRGE